MIMWYPVLSVSKGFIGLIWCLLFDVYFFIELSIESKTLLLKKPVLKYI